MKYIQIINGRWTINGKTFKEMTFSERNFLLPEYIKHATIQAPTRCNK